MAAIAIPIVVLGSLYILSEQEKKTENFQEEIQEKQLKEQFTNGDNSKQQQQQQLLQAIKPQPQQQQQQQQQSQLQEGFSNYSTRKVTESDLQQANVVNSYNNSNQHTDKYFNNTNLGASMNMLSGEVDRKSVSLLTGETMDPNSFKHNNMQPYFGAKIRGATADLNTSESILDSKQGTGSQSFSKNEQAPLFKPDGNMNFINGTPNNSDFFQSRMNESMKMSNVTLWEPQRVGPGLNAGYGSQNERGHNTGGTAGNDGFNAGMMSRDAWKPKTVDDLRVENNPKQSFDLLGHQGPAISAIKNQGPNDKIGKVEKHLPEKYYDNGPQRWFTTSGIEKNPPIRSTHVIPMENRIDTTREYYGGGTNTTGQATYAQNKYEESKKINLEGLPISNASAQGQNFAGSNDYSRQGYHLLPNNRITDKDNMEMGGVYGMAKAAIAPLLDILKPSRKENAIGNLRQSGNVNGTNPAGHVYNSLDKTKVTNREMTTGKIDMNYVNVQGQNHRGNAYQVTEHQPSQNQRDTTNTEYIGAGSAQGSGLRPYNAAYAQQNNVNKTYELRPNQGSMSLFNNDQNMDMNRDESMLQNNRGNVPNGGPNMVPSADFMGEVQGMQTYDPNFDSNRMDASLLSAFKNNPYTQSLNSVA